MTDSKARQALHRLAHTYGVQLSYLDAGRQRREASDEALLAVLQALGASLASIADAPAALFARRQEVFAFLVAPSHVFWEGSGALVPLRLPEGASPDSVCCTLTLESGEERMLSAVVRSGRASVTLPDPLPLGYHALSVETGGRLAQCQLIAAPTRAYSPDPDQPMWGVFLPLYALHSRESWGAGDLSDLEALARWTAGQGGSLVGTLPLLAAYLDRPYDVSPYSPVSRLFWNEFYLDVKRLPELGLCAEARALLESTVFQEETNALSVSPLVDYRRQMALKRRVLEALSSCLFSGPSQRQETLWAWVRAHSEAGAYARFRAAMEGLRQPWGQWPDHMRRGELTAAGYDEDAYRYHLYVQWAMAQQMEALAQEGRHAGAGLYLDLPLGVHREGYDAWRWQDLFVPGATLGAPPDPLGPEGQEWGIVPLHPQRLAGQGLAYFTACLRHHMACAKALRLDHVMGLHRMFWVPRGMSARDGVYVRYPDDALYAAIALESLRHQTMVIGEDLGTVPRAVRPAMARHGLRRMYVAQFAVAADPSSALRPAPFGSVASLNTHDTPTFAGFLEGADLDLRVGLGTLDGSSAAQEKEGRRAVAKALGSYLASQGLLEGDASSPEALASGALVYLGESHAGLVVTNLEDLWGETHQQNLPGTVKEHPNWQQKARFTLEEFTAMPQVLQALAALKQARLHVSTSTAQDSTERVVFSVLAPAARSISLVGDFNAWDALAMPMHRQAEGLWQATIALSPGMHQYKFLVDGVHWLEDPTNPLRLPNPFGSYNSVREVLAHDG